MSLPFPNGHPETAARQLPPWKERVGRARPIAALALIVAVCSFTTLRFAVSEARIYRKTGGRDDTVRQLEQFAPVGRLLAPGQTVGYVSDDPSTTAFYRARYAAVPATVVASEEPAVLVGWFQNPTNLMAAMARLGLVVSHDLGHGVFLLRKIQP